MNPAWTRYARLANRRWTMNPHIRHTTLRGRIERGEYVGYIDADIASTFGEVPFIYVNGTRVERAFRADTRDGWADIYDSAAGPMVPVRVFGKVEVRWCSEQDKADLMFRVAALEARA